MGLARCPPCARGLFDGSGDAARRLDASEAWASHCGWPSSNPPGLSVLTLARPAREGPGSGTLLPRGFLCGAAATGCLPHPSAGETPRRDGQRLSPVGLTSGESSRFAIRDSVREGQDAAIGTRASQKLKSLYATTPAAAGASDPAHHDRDRDHRDPEDGQPTVQAPPELGIFLDAAHSVLSICMKRLPPRRTGAHACRCCIPRDV